jgi:K(+)-stimulated pyrophosphate-energized sodium pump
MVEISLAIKEGAIAFLHREYFVMSIFVAIVTVLIAIFISWKTAVCFVFGAVISAGCGYAGMMIAVRSNVRTCQAATESLNAALRVAFSSGAVMGMSCVGFGLLGCCVFYLMFGDFVYLAGFGMGASSIALFARVGGGIYTKAADVGSDLVGKVEAGIPEDDPRNPGVIADNVGDNVGDVAGMGADLFESYVGSFIAAATLGADFEAGMAPHAIALPILIALCGILCCMVGTFAVRTKEEATQES